MLPSDLRESDRKVGGLSRQIAVGIFALIIVGAPLAFGAGDRLVQVGLLALLAAGMLFLPPRWPRFSKWEKRLLIAGGALIFLKEFAPAAWFGHTAWRTTLTQSFGLALPWTHNPEPVRVLDSLLAGASATLWFAWVRALAAERRERVMIAWILFGSAIVLAIVCFVMPGRDSAAIYGVRAVPGWGGFGPFPNRNHTACFLAMGALLGCGCAARAGRRKQFGVLSVALAGLITVFIALIESKSRGGMIACVLGTTIYAGLALAHSTSRKTLGILLAGALVAAALLLSFGGKLWSRFDPGAAGSDIPTNLRWGVWHDSLEMWRDAPLLGHGVATFARFFPLYQSIPLENQLVLHPESSWMKWLDELGALPLMLLTAGGLMFLARGLRGAFAAPRGIFIFSAGFAAVAVLLIHGIWDVPVHRWATAGFGLAALAMACPPREEAAADPRERLQFILPLGIAAFWALEIFTDFPRWSPARLTRTLDANDVAPARVWISTLNEFTRFFPLQPELHQALGARLLRAQRSLAWKHFRIANRLRPGSWTLPASQAVASHSISPGMALHFWTVAIERAGRRRVEIFRMAYRHTATLAGAESFWSQYVHTNPSLLLVYSAERPESEAREHFEDWWARQALSRPPELDEVDLVYAALLRWGTLGQMEAWSAHFPDLEERDFRKWASIFHEKGDDTRAWQILAKHVPDPPFPSRRSSTHTNTLEATWLKNPNDVVNAQSLAAAWHAAGETEKSKNVILTVAARPAPPPWFSQKAAHLHAAGGDFEKAVATLLK